MAVIRTKGNTFNFAQAVTPGAKGDVGDASNKVDKDPTTGIALIEQLPYTQEGVGGLLARFDDDGFLKVHANDADGYATEYSQVRGWIDELTGGGGVLKKVSGPTYAPGTSLALNTDGVTYTTLPTINVTDAATDEVYDCFPVLIYSGPGGLKIRRKGNGSGVTNMAADPSLEAGAAPGWSSSGGITLAVDNADARSGTYSLKATVTVDGTGGQQVYSPWCPIEQGVKASTAGYIKRITATGRTCRVDAQYATSAATNVANAPILASVTGANVTPGVNWTTRGIMDSANLGGTGSQTAPTGATQVRLRFTIVSPASSDIFRLDDYQVERSATIPAYGSTGGSGGALSCNGLWYPDVASTQAAGATSVVSTFATTGTKGLAGFFRVGVGGTALVNQRIEWEVAQASANATATTISYAAATFARIAVGS